MSDVELLEAYVRDRSETAFATLVERHVNLVYSAARRQVHSPHLAEDVAQAVFVELSRHAARIPPAQPLAAWLYVVTRRTAIDAVRHESRRLARETTAAEIAAMKTPSETWSKVEASVDEAMATLNDTERAAVVLRFFQNLSLREVGAELGISEDTAQKRVSRALDHLRTFFTARGVAVTAAGLATDLSAHALQIAPAGLATTISNTAALSSVTSAAVLETSRVIVMTTLQKSLAVTAFLVVGGTGLYQATLVARQTDDLHSLHAQTARLSTEIGSLRSARDRSLAQLKTIERQIDERIASARATSPADAALAAQMNDWLGRIDQIKQFLARRSDLNIPELQQLPESAWFSAVGNKPIESDEAARQITSRLRHTAENQFTPKLQGALRGYLKAHDNTLPSSPQDLAPFFDPPVDRAILDRYEVLQAGKLDSVPAADRRKILSVKSPADPEIDALWMVGPTSYGNTAAMAVNYAEAMRRFKEVNPGVQVTSAAQLRPYLKWPVRDEAIQRVLDYVPGKPL